MRKNCGYVLILVLLVCGLLSACGEPAVPQATYDELKAQFDAAQTQSKDLQTTIDDLQKQLDELQQNGDEISKKLEEAEKSVKELSGKLKDAEAENETLTAKIDELENGPATLIVAIRNAVEAKDWELVVKLADELHERANGSAEDVEGQKHLATAKKAIKKAEDEKAAEEAKAYKTGITFDQLSRKPDEYKGKKVTFRGRVFQSFDQSGQTCIMMAVDGNYNRIMYITMPTANMTSRVLENDYITVKGVANGIYTYESAGNGMQSVPWVKADDISR